MREFLRQFFQKISLNHTIVITGIASWRSWKSSSQVPQNILNGVHFQKTEIFLTIDVIKAWQIGVEPSTSDSFTCFFSSFFAFFVSFDIQVITQKVKIFFSAKNFNLLFVYMWASDLNFLLSLVGYTGSADSTFIGAIACPSFTELSSFLWLRGTKPPLDLRSYFVSDFTDQDTILKDRNILHLCTKTVCLWPRFVFPLCNMYCNLLTKSVYVDLRVSRI